MVSWNVSTGARAVLGVPTYIDGGPEYAFIARFIGKHASAFLGTTSTVTYLHNARQMYWLLIII